MAYSSAGLGVYYMNMTTKGFNFACELGLEAGQNLLEWL
jgi:hypothetical protein